ncbi:MAG: Gfo/Idh/MocA family oxidoreductase [Phycisphaeraceae bacterium]
MPQPTRISRRRFIQAAAATSAWALGASSYSRVLGANAKLNVAFIGTSGIAAGQHIPPLQQLGAGCTCYCDADQNRFGPAFNRWPEAKGYTDYREMYDKHHNEIDAVMVGTPDHHHYPASIIGMMLGKHMYTQKPLTHTMWEARQLAIAAERYKVATQMGNQMHANEGNRRIVEWVRSGQLGVIKEAHIWTNRPVWPQGNPRPEPTGEPPANLNWDAWVGPAPMRPYSGGGRRGAYHPFNWRGFLDFGTGALGDMGCHTTDGFYWGMDPGFPTAAELLKGEPVADKDQYASQSVVKFEFPEKLSRPGFNYYWYEGGLKPEKPDFVEGGGELGKSGGFIIGERGAIQYMDDYGNRIKVYAFGDNTLEEPPKTLSRSEGHHKEWYEACIGNKPYYYPRSGFRYAAMLTESVLLGTIAQKVGGRLEYDSHNQKITNNDSANQHISKTYRKGWEFKMD